MPNANPGWYHSDGQHRDHAFEPEDGRSGDDEVTRVTGVMDQARAEVKGTMQKQFDYLHAENVVNDLFKDRR